MSTPIEIVDRGRGPQLSTSRITVQDVFPYLQRQCTFEEVREIIPILTAEEFHAIEKYVQDHYDEVTDQDARIRQRAASRRKPPHVEQSERHERLERLEKMRQSIRQGKQEPNGDLSSR